jgi:hypothetical protein
MKGAIWKGITTPSAWRAKSFETSAYSDLCAELKSIQYIVQDERGAKIHGADVLNECKSRLGHRGRR